MGLLVRSLFLKMRLKTRFSFFWSLPFSGCDAEVLWPSHSLRMKQTGGRSQENLRSKAVPWGSRAHPTRGLLVVWDDFPYYLTILSMAFQWLETKYQRGCPLSGLVHGSVLIWVSSVPCLFHLSSLFKLRFTFLTVTVQGQEEKS